MPTFKAVLIVDDEYPDIARLAKELLRNSNYIATAVNDSVEAWNTLNNTTVLYDIVVASGRKGLGLLIKISLEQRFKRVQLVWTSGGTEIPDGCVELGIRFLPKPFGRPELLEVLG